MQRKATGPDYRTDGVTLSARGPLIWRVFGDYLANLRVMAMKTLASELGEIDGMKDAGQIDSPTARELRAVATATALGRPTPRVLITPASGASAGGSADLDVFVRVREDRAELVSRTIITVPRGST